MVRKGLVHLVSLNLVASMHTCLPTYILPRVLLNKKLQVGPKNIDEKQASISYFLVNEGGSKNMDKKQASISYFLVK